MGVCAERNRLRGYESLCMRFQQVTTCGEAADERKLASDLMPELLHLFFAFSLWDGGGTGTSDYRLYLFDLFT
jgi:hypothetical protein